MTGFAAFAVGAALGLRFNVVAIAVAIAAASVALAIGKTSLVEIVLVLVALQAGYLAGAVTRFGAVPFSSTIFRERLRHAVNGFRSH
jgi:hypothetical protein